MRLHGVGIELEDKDRTIRSEWQYRKVRKYRGVIYNIPKGWLIVRS